MTRGSVFGLLAAFVTGMVIVAEPASAGTMSRSAVRGQATPMVPLFAWEREACGIYPLQNPKIDRQPEHGTVTISKVNVKLPASFGVCAGTMVNMPWVIYRSAGNFSGVDHFGVSWYSHATVLENTNRYNSYDVNVTVK